MRCVKRGRGYAPSVAIIKTMEMAYTNRLCRHKAQIRQTTIMSPKMIYAMVEVRLVRHSNRLTLTNRNEVEAQKPKSSLINHLDKPVAIK